MNGRFGLVVVQDSFWEKQPKNCIHRKGEVNFIKELAEFNDSKLYLVWCCMFKEIGHKDSLPFYVLAFNNQTNEIESVRICPPHSEEFRTIREEFQKYDYEKDINKNQTRIIRVKK